MPLPRVGNARRAYQNAAFQQQQQEREGTLMQGSSQAPMGQPGSPGPMQPQSRFAAQPRFSVAGLSRKTNTRDRRGDLLTAKEIDEAIEKQEDSGKLFRLGFLVVVLAVLFLLAFMKYDVEERQSTPEALLMLAGAGSSTDGDAKAKEKYDGPTIIESSQEDKDQLESYYSLLGINDRLKKPVPKKVVKQETEPKKDASTQQSTEKPAEAEKDGQKSSTDEPKKVEEVDEREQIRRETLKQNWELKKKMKEAFDSHLEERGQLVHCGRQCEGHHKSMELAYTTLSGQIDQELYGLVYDHDVAQHGKKRIDQSELKERYLKKKQEIEEKEKDDKVYQEMALAELKDAYEILADPDARKYYHLYGRKPPEAMRHTSARHGGWGQDLLLRTHKNRLILAWLDYLADAWADYAVLIVIGLVGFALPALVQLPRIIEMAQEIEARGEEMARLEAAAAGRN